MALYKAHVDENFDKFELYVLSNILRIPDHVVLPAVRPHLSLPI